MPTPQLSLGLLRSVLRIGGESETDLLSNINMLRAEVAFDTKTIDGHIILFVGSIADRVGAVPDFATVYSHYDLLVRQGDSFGTAGLIRLGEVRNASVPFWPSTDYRYHLDRFKEEITGDTLGQVLQQTSAILTTGYAPKVAGKHAVTLKGPSDALHYVEAELSALQAQFFTGDIEGSFRLDASVAWAEYEKRKQAVAAGKKIEGVLSGYPDIDNVHGGLMPGDLCLVLGYTSQFKSTFCLNWAYHAAVYYGKNVAVIPTEMSASTMRDILGVIHCYHPDFEKVYGGTINVCYDDVWRGTLSPGQEAIFKAALHDLQTGKDYGQILYREPQGVIRVSDIKRWAEQQDRKVPLHMLLIDYIGQVDPSSGGSSLRESALANMAIRETKQMATSFRNGKGIAVLSPFQSSREGFKEAEKNKGVYSLRAMAWAPEAERSSDLVYSLYTNDQLREAMKIQWGNLKARKRRQISGIHELYCNAPAQTIQHYAPDRRPSQSVVHSAMIDPNNTGQPTPAVSTTTLSASGATGS